MGIHLEPVDLDRQFETHSGPTPIIINDMPAFSETDIDLLNRTIYTTFSNDLLNNIPSCECGETVGQYNLNVVCKECRTPVQSILNQDLQPLVWLRAPKDVRALMNPIVWTMLSEQFKIGSFSVIHWLCDTNYQAIYNGNISANVMQVLRSIEESGIERGWNNFVDRFDDTIIKLFGIKQFQPKKGEQNKLYQLLSQYRNCIFSKHIPIPHRSLLVVEETDVGVFVDPITTGAINAIRTLAGIDTDLSTYSTRVKENRTVRSIVGLAEFYELTYKNIMAEKEGVFRKHAYATRSHFSFRTVVSSITGPHNHDEIHIPWGGTTVCFKLSI